MSHVHVSCPWWCFVKCLQSYLCFSRFLLCVSRASCLSSPDCVHLCVVSLLCLTLISLQSVYSLSCRLCMFLVLLSCVLSLLGGAPLDLEIVFKDMFCICASCNYSTRKVGKWQARWSVSVIIDHTDVRLVIMMLLKQTVRLTIIKFQRNVYVSKERSVSSSKLFMGVQSFSDTSFGRWMWETGRDSQNPKTGAGGEDDRERERKALDQSDDDRIEYET